MGIKGDWPLQSGRTLKQGLQWCQWSSGVFLQWKDVCYRLNVFPPNSYAEALTSHCECIWGLREVVKWGSAGATCHYKSSQEEHPHQKASQPTPGYWTSRVLELRHKILFLKPPNLWCFVNTVLTVVELISESNSFLLHLHDIPSSKTSSVFIP